MGLADRDLSPADRRAVEIMRRSMADSEEQGSLAPVGKCEDAQRKDIEYAALREALYACFGALVELPGLRRRQGHARRCIRSADAHGRAGTAQEAVPRVRAAVASDQRQERARQSVSARRRDGRGARPQGRNRDRCGCEDGRCVDGGSRALAGADTGRVAQGERRYADGAVGLPLSRRRDRARARRCDRTRGDAAAQRALLPRSRRAARARGT